MMVPCPFYEPFIKEVKKRPDFDYGLHLTLNSEFGGHRWGPVADRKKVASIANPGGGYWGDSDDTARYALAKHVKIELKAQIDKALKAGIPVSHLDTHMGTCFSRFDLAEVYVDLGIEYDIPVLWVKNFDTREGARIGDEYDLDGRARELQARLEEHKLPVLDYVEMFYGTRSHKRVYVDALRNLKPGVTEIIIHCGYADSELRGLTRGAGSRDGDRRIFKSRIIRDVIKEENIKVINWKKFHEMTRKGEL